MTPEEEQDARRIRAGFEPKQGSVLGEAQQIIYGDREQTYGRPDKNLAVIANLWNSYIASKEGQPLDARDVCMLMILLKVARHSNVYTRDNLVDICGYAALNERIENGTS